LYSAIRNAEVLKHFIIIIIFIIIIVKCELCIMSISLQLTNDMLRYCMYDFTMNASANWHIMLYCSCIFENVLMLINPKSTNIQQLPIKQEP